MFRFDRSCRTRATRFNNTAKCLAQLLSPFSKITRSHGENLSHLAEIVCNTTIEPDEVLVSFDVKSLFTSVPVKEAVECVKRILQADASWELQSPIPISTIIKLLTICLEDTTFKFREEFYKNDGRSRHGIARLSRGSRCLHGGLGAHRHRPHAGSIVHDRGFASSMTLSLSWSVTHCKQLWTTSTSKIPLFSSLWRLKKTGSCRFSMRKLNDKAPTSA